MAENTRPAESSIQREDEADRDDVEVLAAEFVERHRNGEGPSITEYESKYPQLAVEIRDLFPTIAAMERLKLQKERPPGTPASFRGAQLERLGEFRIIREVGRGGMGIVFEAEQESLKRRVAIKVLPRHALFSADQLKRFRREAQIAGRLQHPNIVGVFGVGENDGFHYYVMQFIDGVGLDKVISNLTDEKREHAGAETQAMTVVDTAGKESERVNEILKHWRPDLSKQPRAARRSSSSSAAHADARYWRTVVDMGVQVAKALDYAHAQGTLHCDIKPANLLLDAQGVVRITDFGVAKALQVESVTKTGDVAGTLQYMAPERFKGQTDARSDVYSLGLTLCEMLTLQPALGDCSRHELIRRIMSGEAISPRSLNPSIPHDLETIILKATSQDPTRRYRTAGAMAEDLQRYLEDRPIQARRTSIVERSWRWCRRNRVIAALLCTIAMLMVAIAVLASIDRRGGASHSAGDNAASGDGQGVGKTSGQSGIAPITVNAVSASSKTSEPPKRWEQQEFRSFWNDADPVNHPAVAVPRPEPDWDPVPRPPLDPNDPLGLGPEGRPDRREPPERRPGP